ncbi:hypothetical protein Tco_0385710 [Tanacetum coccineum]
MEANYEVLESLLIHRRRQVRNEDLHTELDYNSEDYDEERKMEPRPIEDYPLPDGLKMPSHMGSYDGKKDPDNYLHLFKAKEVAINEAPNDHKESFNRFNNGFSWDNNKGKKNQDSYKVRETCTLSERNKERKGKTFTQLGEWKKGDKDIVSVEPPILTVNKESLASKRKSIEGPVNGIREITFHCFRFF